MLRTLVFGLIAGIAGKKLYDSGALDRFGNDLKTRLDDAKATFDEKLTEKRATRSADAALPRTRTAPKLSPEPGPAGTQGIPTS